MRQDYLDIGEYVRTFIVEPIWLPEPLQRLVDAELAVKTTRYFEEQVLRKRPYIRREWCEEIVANPIRRQVQTDGRIRHWGAVAELGGRVLRVVTLEDGETILNAFPDRDFKLP